MALIGVMGMMSTSYVMAEAPKIATVDMQKLFREYYRTVAAQKRFNVEYARIQKGVSERTEAMGKLSRMLRAMSAKVENKEMTEGEKEKLRGEAKLMDQELRMMRDELKRYVESEKMKVAKLKGLSMRGIMDEIRKKVIEHSKEQGFDFVFDISGKNTNQVSFFIFLKDAQDITDNMLKELNKFAPDARG